MDNELVFWRDRRREKRWRRGGRWQRRRDECVLCEEEAL